MAETIERGEIRNRDFAKQLRNFKGLRFGSNQTITPTDIDGFFEINNQIFVFIELKFGSAKLPRGQELAFERLVDTIEEKKNAIFIIGIHNLGFETDIDAALCNVKKYRTRKEWKFPKRDISVKELADKFIEYAKKKEII